MKNPLNISEQSIELAKKEKLKLSTSEFKQLSVDYHKITSKVLKDCGSCLNMAFKIVRNYIKLHNKDANVKQEQPNPERKTVLVAGEKKWEDMKLPELRKLFPEIKATKKDDFIEKIGDYRV